MNLTCGRNPWKRASVDDSTFRAYRSNPRFLSSILPLSAELDVILGRIFECDPRKRIGIPELRDLILGCPRFTTRSSGTFPPTPPSEPQHEPDSPLRVVPDFLQSLDQCAANSPISASTPFRNPVMAQGSASSRNSSSSDDGSTFSAISSCSSSSSHESLEDPSTIPESRFAPPQPSTHSHYTHYFRNCFSVDPIPGPILPQPFLAPVQVC